MTAIGLLLRQRLTRLAILTVALAQVGVAVAPHTGSFSDSTPTRPHLHGFGDQLEYMHDEAACPACNGPHLATQPAVQVKISVAPTRPLRMPESRKGTFESATQCDSVLSRAPPAIV